MLPATRDESHTTGVTTTAGELVGLLHATPAPGESGRRGAVHALAGPYLSAFKGGGIEFDEVRAYQRGDDARSIDWRVTARTGRPHSRVFREERERPVWLLVDLGPEMHFGTRRAFKSVVAARCATLLSGWAREEGDRVGGFVRSAVGFIAHPARSDEARHLDFLSSLAEGTSAHVGECPLSLDEAVGRLAEDAHRGSRVDLISDFEQLGAAGRVHLADLARRCDVTCVLVYDPLELEAPPAGEYRISDGRGVHAVRVGGAKSRERYRGDFEHRVAGLREFCLEHRVQLVAIRVDEDPAEVLPEVVLGRRLVR